MTDVECRECGPDGTRCQKILGHHLPHGGVDRTGVWRLWT
jgi:hypothetical protein